MKKTYKNTLPKNMEVKSINIRIENGEVLVDVELKDEFEPKDGDFLVSSSGNIFIYKAYTCLGYGAYCGIDTCNTIVCNYTTPAWTCKQGCRFATSEEKAAFLARLEKECGKKWNEETKELEDIRWRANLGEKYWYISDTSVLEDNELAANDDDVRYKNKNYFRTPDTAQKVADQIKEIFKNSKAE